MAARNHKISAYKNKLGIELPKNKDEKLYLSLLNPIPIKYVESIISEYLGSYEKRETRSLSTTEATTAPNSGIPSALLYKEDKKIEEEYSDAGEDKDTQDCSESPHEIIVNEFTQIFKENKHCWEERTRSMKKNNIVLPFQPSTA